MVSFYNSQRLRLLLLFKVKAVGIKGHQSQLGEGEIWDETKTEAFYSELTATGKALLDFQVLVSGLSRAEYLERFARYMNAYLVTAIARFEASQDGPILGELPTVEETEATSP